MNTDIDYQSPMSHSTDECDASSPSERMNSMGLIVRRIQQGDQNATADLYAILADGMRWFLRRRLGPVDYEDAFNDVFLVTVNAIQGGSLRDPQSLMGFVRVVAHRTIAQVIERRVQDRKGNEKVFLETATDFRPDPEKESLYRWQVDVMKQTLRELSARDREVLERFYLLEQAPEHICAAMGLSETQFRLLKSRAKARFGELGKSATSRTRRETISVRVQYATS